MDEFCERQATGNLTVKLRRGERMCLLAFDVADPTNLAGFAIEVKAPGAAEFVPLNNRLAFNAGQYTTGNQPGSPTGSREFPSTTSPFQTFRWIHFPWQPIDRVYTYRVTEKRWSGNSLIDGDSITLGIPLYSVTYDGFVDVGFTRNFASSQAYQELFGNQDILPKLAADGLTFNKPVIYPKGQTSGDDIYEWLGFKAKDLVFGLLDEAVSDTAVTLDAFAYDLNEPDIVDRLKKLGNRLRIIIDDSADHGLATSAESKAAAMLAGAGAAVRRTHFSGLQHNKVLILRRAGAPLKVICGSTNFSFRGLYIQANNVLKFSDPTVAGLFGKLFEIAFANPGSVIKDQLSQAWSAASSSDGAHARLAFSPHHDPSLSLGPVAAAVDQASSSVLFSIAFLNMDRNGPVRQAIDRLMNSPLFSYGVVDKDSGLNIVKPDHSQGLVDFGYLASHAPPPFNAEWSGGAGIRLHHKFIVTDFDLPTAKLFSGSSNLANGGESSNGDHLIEIDDARIASVYAVEALRMFDHLHFRANMKAAGVAPGGAPAGAGAPTPLVLQGPPTPGVIPWWTQFYTAGSQKMADRQLFSRA